MSSVRAALRLAVLSIHSSPAGELGTSDTGGMSVYVRALARELGARGHRVDIFTRRPDGRADPVIALHPNVRLVHLDGSPAGRRGRSELYADLPLYFEALEGFRAGRGLSYDLLHSHYWLSSLIGIRAAQRWHVPHFVTFHTLGAVKNAARCGEKEPALRLASEAEIARACHRILAPTDRERGDLALHCGVAPEKVAVIPCGVDRQEFHPMARSSAREALGLGQGETILLYVGRFAPVKGLDHLLEGISLLRHRSHLRLVVVGGDGGASAEPFRAQARDLGVDHAVTFAGRMEHVRLPLFYNAADLLVVPSHCESFGLVALEALACGTPVVASRVGAMEELLAREGNGVLVPPSDPGALARGVEAVLAWPRPSRQSRERIRASVSKYTWSSAAEAVAAEYARLTGIFGGPGPEVPSDLYLAAGGEFGVG